MERGHIMDIQVLEYIVTIADCGSISRAAQKLFITQSGLNQQLIKLENRLGIKIFERDNHHLEITPAGQLIVDSATEILRIRRNTLTQLSDLQSSISGLISLGLTHEHGIDVFTAIYQQFHQRYPHINFSLKEKIVADQYQMLGRGSLDLGIVLIKKLPANLQRTLIREDLYQEDLLLGIPLSHPLASRAVPLSAGKPLRVIDLHLFKDDPFALIFKSSTMRQDVIDPLFEKSRFYPHIMLETAMNNALATLVSRGFCCTILPHSRVLASRHRNECAWFRLMENPTWSVSVVRRKDYRLGEATRYLLELAKQYGRSMEEQFSCHSPGYNR